MESESGVTEKVVEFKDLDVLTKSELLSNRKITKSNGAYPITREEQLGHLYDSMVEYTHSKAQLRDMGDGFGMSLIHFGGMDQLVSTTNYSMKLMGDAVFGISDKMDSEISVFENKILPVFASFGSAFKMIRRELHLGNQAEAHHSAKRTEYAKYMEKMKGVVDGHHSEKGLELRRKLNQRMTDSSRYRRKCVKKFTKLETKRSEDLKKIMTTWFRAQAAVAAKTLELSTQACQSGMSIDAVGDCNKLINDLNLQASVGSTEDLESDEDIQSGGDDEDTDDDDGSYYAPVKNSSSNEFPRCEVKNEMVGCGDSKLKKVHRDNKKECDIHGSSHHPNRHPNPNVTQKNKQKHRKL